MPEQLAGPRPKVWLALRPSSIRTDLVIGGIKFPRVSCEKLGTGAWHEHSGARCASLERIACDAKFPEVAKDLKDTLAKQARQLWEGGQQSGEQGQQGRPGVITAELNCRSCVHRSVGVAHLAANLLQNEGFEVELVHDESGRCRAKGCQACQQPVGSPVEFNRMLEAIRDKKLGRIWPNTTIWPPLFPARAGISFGRAALAK